MNRANISYYLHDMIPGKAGGTSPRVIYRSEDGILDCYGTTVPTNGTAGYAVGCTFRKTNADVLASGTVDSADATSLIDATLATTYDTNDELIGLYVHDINKEIMGLIDDYAYATGDITVDDWTDYSGTAVANTIYPAAGDAFQILRLSAPTIYKNVGDHIRGCRFRPLAANDANSHATTGMELGPSQSIWNDCPILEIMQDPAVGIYLFDDFTWEPVADSAVQVGEQWLLLGTNADIDGSSVNGASALGCGVVELEGSAGDNDEAYLVSNCISNEAIKLNSGRQVWFEIRLKVELGAGAADDFAFLAGLMEAEGMVDDAIADNGADIIDKDFIGFLAVTNGTTMGDVKAVYRQDGGATTAVVTAITHANYVNDAFMKLGFKFDGVDTVTFYLNGESLGTTLDVDGLTGDKIDDALGIIFGVKSCEATQCYMAIDWVRFAQTGRS